MNTVALIGRLTADPQTHAGETHESATFRLAVPKAGSDAVQFLGAPTKGAKADGPDGGVAEMSEKPAIAAYRRKAS